MKIMEALAPFSYSPSDSSAKASHKHPIYT